MFVTNFCGTVTTSAKDVSFHVLSGASLQMPRSPAAVWSIPPLFHTFSVVLFLPRRELRAVPAPSYYARSL